MKGRLNLRFGKKKNNDTNIVTTQTDTEPPKLSLDALMLNPKFDDTLSDTLPVVSTSPPVKVNSSAATNSGLLGEILGELSTTGKTDLSDDLVLNAELSKLLETSSNTNIQTTYPTSAFSNSNATTSRSAFSNNNNHLYNRFNLPSNTLSKPLSNDLNKSVSNNESLKPNGSLATRKPLDSESDSESSDSSSDHKKKSKKSKKDKKNSKSKKSKKIQSSSSSSSESEDSFTKLKKAVITKNNINAVNGKKLVNPAVQRKEIVQQKINNIENWVQDVNPKEGENNILDRMKDRHRAEARALPPPPPPPPPQDVDRYNDHDRYNDYDNRDRYDRYDRYERDVRDRDDRDYRDPRSDGYSEDSRDMREDRRYDSRDRDDYRRDPRPRNKYEDDVRPTYDDRYDDRYDRSGNKKYPRERNHDYEKGISSNSDHSGDRQNRMVQQTPNNRYSSASSASSTTSDSQIGQRYRNNSKISYNRPIDNLSKNRSNFTRGKIREESREEEERSLSSISSRNNNHDQLARKGSYKNLKQTHRSSVSSEESSDSDEEPNHTRPIPRTNLRLPVDPIARASILSVDSDIVPLGTKYGINVQDSIREHESPDEDDDDAPLKMPTTTVNNKHRSKLRVAYLPSSDSSSSDDDDTNKRSNDDETPRSKILPPQQSRALPPHIRQDRKHEHSRSNSYDSNGYRDRDELRSPPPPPIGIREKPVNRYPMQYRDEPPYDLPPSKHAPYPYREEALYDGSRSKYTNYPLPPEPQPFELTPENNKKVPLIEMAGYRYDQNKRNPKLSQTQNQTVQPFTTNLERMGPSSPPKRRGYNSRERERYLPQERGEYPPPRRGNNGYDDRGDYREREREIDRYDRYNDRYNDHRYNDRYNDRNNDRYNDRERHDRHGDRYDRYYDRYD